MDKKLKELKDLKEKILYHNKKYYTDGVPEISDVEYDDMYNRLNKLEIDLKIDDIDSPTKKVGAATLSGFEKYRYKNRILSLGKAQNAEDIREWVARMKKGLIAAGVKKEEVDDLKFVLEDKFDGLTLCLFYKDGKLVMATTRGNGEIGEIVTSQALTISNIPKKIEYKGNLVVRGEAMMPLSALKEYNSGRDEEDKLKNARNAVSGAIRNIHVEETKNRKLILFGYDIVESDKHFTTHVEEIDFLKSIGIPIHNIPINEKNKDKQISIKNIEVLIKNISMLKMIRDKYDFLTDGLVIKIDNIRYREILGNTAKFPKGSFAFKFTPDIYESKLLDVEWNVGRTGKLTPVGILEPVEIDGSIVARATLNNMDYIRNKELFINSYIKIRKSNEIIPEILEVYSLDNKKELVKIEEPKVCPFCGEIVSKEEGMVDIFCKNDSCCEKVISQIEHSVSREGLDIVGLSRKTIEQLYHVHKISNVSMIYSITKDQLKSLEGFSERKTNNMLAAIEKSKNIELSNFLYSLGIGLLGKRESSKIAIENKDFNSFVDKVKSKDFNTMLLVNNNIRNYIEDNYEYLKEMTNIFNIKNSRYIDRESIKSSKIINKSFVITGTLSESRSYFEKLIEKNGGKIKSAISKNVDFLLLGKNGGSKKDKAEKLKITIISEEEFNDII